MGHRFAPLFRRTMTVSHRTILTTALEEMGKYNGRPLRDIIEGLRSDDNENIEGFNVVICGPLAAGFPLGAVTWKELAISKYLCDYVEIRYAPSAFMVHAYAASAAEAESGSCFGPSCRSEVVARFPGER